jgi:hypothetical protein
MFSPRHFFYFWLMLLSAAATVGLVIITTRNLAPQQRFEMTLGQDRPMITKLGPPPRVVSRDNAQDVLEGPVYFTLRAPRWYDAVTITVEYQPGALDLTGIGGQTAEGFQYAVTPVTTAEATEDGWRRASIQLDRNQLYNPKNTTQILLQTGPGAGMERGLRIRSITATLSR